MTDRLAAERACKDPNPIIDGRKANVNLAYLGAKPRSLQTGERGKTHPVVTLKLYIFQFYLLLYPYHLLVEWHNIIFSVPPYRHIYWCAAYSSGTYSKAVWVSHTFLSVCSVLFIIVTVAKTLSNKTLTINAYTKIKKTNFLCFLSWLV